ncbi:MAG: VWA domain-containing protein [Pseudomonadota bacterium]
MNAATGEAMGKPLAHMLPVNIMHFCRALRRADLPIGTDKSLLAVKVAQEVGVARREDFAQALAAALLSNPAERFIFDQIFRVFWRDPELLKRLMAMASPLLESTQQRRPQVSRRAAQALSPPTPPQAASPRMTQVTPQAFSATQVDRHRDFEDMSLAEQQACGKQLLQTVFADVRLLTRRYAPSRQVGIFDMRRMMRATVRGRDALPLYRNRQTKTPPVVLLIDISGSMATYSRIFLHFAYAMHAHYKKVETFLFGTRLWHITPMMTRGDPDEVMRRLGQQISDWEGGTRIGACLHEFGQYWATRALTSQSEVLLLTDGLDRQNTDLERDLARLRRRSRRLLWLNPLLRYDRYKPLAWGAKILHAQCDGMLAMYNLASVHDLVGTLAKKPSR